jgi:chromate transport protein ChrA
MGSIWLIVTAILMAVGVYMLGRLDVPGNDWAGVFWCIFLGSLFWPLVLTAVIIFGPFVGFYLLGVRQREKKAESLENK